MTWLAVTTRMPPSVGGSVVIASRRRWTVRRSAGMPGQVHAAADEVNPADGSVRYGGVVHRSLSSAGRAVKVAVSGPSTP